MNKRSKWVSIFLIAALAAGLIYVSGAGYTLGNGSEGSLFNRKQTLILWYSDDALTDYLNEVAVAYNESNSKYRIEPELKDGFEFLQSVNQASVQDDPDMPDIYILPDASLGRAVLAGLAENIEDTEELTDTVDYPQPAIDAVTYKGNIVAYPFYFDTAALLYNQELLDGMAEGMGKTSEEIVPTSITDIITLADQYNAPEGVDKVFDFDVNDIFYNYYFLGDSISVGGKCGDDSSTIDIYNSNAIEDLLVYQQIKQFFSIDTSTSSYDSVMDDFMNGRTVFTVATTDAVKTLQDAKDAGVFTSDYGVVSLPNITEELETKGLSVTECLVINGYSENRAAAENFIKFLMTDAHSSDFYSRTGYALVKKSGNESEPHLDGFYEAYEDSVCGTKMPETENFWMLLERMMEKVWDGEDPNENLRELNRQVLVQVTGDESVTVDPIESPETIKLTYEDN